MGTFRTNDLMMSEANIGASIPHFSWLNFLSPGRTVLNPFQINPQVGDAAVPIRSAGLRSEAAKNAIEIEPTNEKKRSTSIKASEHIRPKTSKRKQTKKNPENPKKMKASATTMEKRERKNLNFVTYETRVDISGVPAPVCTCTGVPRQCYRWGAGGWQSSCCTINVSEYPLPMSSTRPGSRMAGRKMSHGAFEKLLQRLAAEGRDLSHPVDLKEHWARHGTNKFVTIK
ncbi:hypothetical protein Nepgr_030634 [Nepenthes gracilis]|uniref:GAGA-binding transcriptional activator n=1 Tax=Nepenthes gracilis TaxID=150966 RepID=A0AAD3TH11_NEPGR|nr:hypothetical protein Nepgr_030634 [Nepenthes gracilis]